MLIRTALVAAALTALPVGAALAQAKTTPTNDPRIDLMFAGRDANNDGRITHEELVAYRTKLFEAADTNKDGVLDSAEMAAHMRARMAKRIAARLAAFDKNKDGKLTLDEVPAPARRHFWRADANLDGVLTVEEMQKAGERRLRRRLMFVFFRVDVDKDGKISKNEFIDAANRFFRRFDRNHDNTVTREEVAAVLASFDRMRRFHRGRFMDRDGHRHGRRGFWHHRRGMHMRDRMRMRDMMHMRDGWRMGPRRGMRDDDGRRMHRRMRPDRTDAHPVPKRPDDTTNQ